MDWIGLDRHWPNLFNLTDGYSNLVSVGRMQPTVVIWESIALFACDPPHIVGLTWRKFGGNSRQSLARWDKSVVQRYRYWKYVYLCHVVLTRAERYGEHWPNRCRLTAECRPCCIISEASYSEVVEVIVFSSISQWRVSCLRLPFSSLSSLPAPPLDAFIYSRSASLLPEFHLWWWWCVNHQVKHPQISSAIWKRRLFTAQKL